MHWVIKMLQLATRPTDTDHQISDFHGKLKFFVLDSDKNGGDYRRSTLTSLT